MLVEGRMRSRTKPGACVGVGEGGNSLSWGGQGGGGDGMVSRAPFLLPPMPPRGTHGLKLFVRVEAGLSSCREVAENPERVSRAALVGVNPVFPCRRGRQGG